ncbi:glycosyltransferase [Pedobacter sp.]|uniref:glycosyltransferase n=1 Tax=Pedobacter sp. TaxID=1411316 RepID=UPI003D7F6C1F
MLLKGKVIFILGIAKFDGQFESTSFTMAKYLALDNDVYYIDYPYTYKDYFLNRNDGYQTRKKHFNRNTVDLIDTTERNLKVVIVPPLLPINFIAEGDFYRFLLGLNEKTILQRIEQVIAKFNITDYIYINSSNFHYPNIGQLLAPKLSVYHCVDPIIGKYDANHGQMSEDIIVQHADLIICTSKQLFKEKSAKNTDTYFIPNAANLELSSQAMQHDLIVNERLNEIPSPIIGYFGNIERRINFDLLFEVASSNQNVSFVFAGPVTESFVPLAFKNLSNVYFIGRIPYAEMPSVLKGFDVCMIPFKKDEVSNTIFPLKLFEYLGAGKPVIATDFNMDLKDFTSDFVAYCATPTAFNAALKNTLQNDDQFQVSERLKIASENTWEVRFNQFSTLLNTYYRQINE